jgi:predicted GNAT family acetyltransferase
MIRLLQSSARTLLSSSSALPVGLNVVSALRSGPSVQLAYLELKQQRLISVSSFLGKQKGSSSSPPSSSSSSSSSFNEKRDDKKKRSLMDAAAETLENVGLKSRSKSSPGSGSRDSQRESRQGHGRDGKSASNRRTTGGGGSPQRDSRTGGSWGDSTTNVTGQKMKSGDRSSSRQPDNHRATGPVRHDKKAKQFVLDLGDNQIARIEYRQLGNGRLELYHTEVPESLRGKGIGKALAKGAFETAARSNLKLKVTCAYLQDYLKRFADDQYKKLVE